MSILNEGQRSMKQWEKRTVSKVGWSVSVKMSFLLVVLTIAKANALVHKIPDHTVSRGEGVWLQRLENDDCHIDLRQGQANSCTSVEMSKAGSLLQERGQRPWFKEGSWEKVVLAKLTDSALLYTPKLGAPMVTTITILMKKSTLLLTAHWKVLPQMNDPGPRA